MGSRAVPGWEPPTPVTLPPAPSGETSASTPDVTSSTAATPSTTPPKRSPCGSALTSTSTPWPSRPSCTSKLSTLIYQCWTEHHDMELITDHNHTTASPAFLGPSCLGMLVGLTSNPCVQRLL